MLCRTCRLELRRRYSCQDGYLELFCANRRCREYDRAAYRYPIRQEEETETESAPETAGDITQEQGKNPS